MKKTIKLTEKQLTNIVKKVIMEQEDTDMSSDISSLLSQAESELSGFEPTDRSNQFEYINEILDALSNKIQTLKDLKLEIRALRMKSIYKH